MSFLGQLGCPTAVARTQVFVELATGRQRSRLLPFPADALTRTSQIRCKLWRGTDSPSPPRRWSSAFFSAQPCAARQRRLAKPMPRCWLWIQPHPSHEIIIPIAITHGYPTQNQPPRHHYKAPCALKMTQGHHRGRVTDEGQRLAGAGQGHPHCHEVPSPPSNAAVTMQPGPLRCHCRRPCNANHPSHQITRLSLLERCTLTSSSARGRLLMPVPCCWAPGQAGGGTHPPAAVARLSTARVRSCRAAGAWQGACHSVLSPSPLINLKRLHTARSGAGRVRTPNVIIKTQMTLSLGALRQDISPDAPGRRVQTEAARH